MQSSRVMRWRRLKKLLCHRAEDRLIARQGVCAFLLALLLCTPSAAEPADARPQDVRRQMVMCGPNSLYLLLHLHGVSVDRRQIEKYMPSYPDRMSLLRLKEACADFGLATEIRRCTLDELSQHIDTPMVAHVLPAHAPDAESGHFIVMFRDQSGSIKGVDATTGYFYQASSPVFQKKWKWNAYILLPVRQASTLEVAYLATGLIWLTAICLLQRRRRKAKT